MKFEVRFEARGNGHAVHVKTAEIGMAGVRRLRIDADVENLQLDRIEGNVDFLVHYSISVDVPEALAVKSGLFETTNQVHVYVPHGWMNQFVCLYPEITEDDTTGEVTKAKLVNHLSDSLVLDAWEKAGFPVDWKEEE